MGQVKIDFSKYKPLPIGKSGWADFSQTCYTVDKTLLIKDLIDDDTAVALFTRPRRFGKTTALKMIRAFFEKTPKDTSFLFTDKKIWAAGEKYRAEQGKYPVIYLTFKDVDGETWDSAFATLKMQIASVIADHLDAPSSLPNASDAARLHAVMDGKGSLEDCAASLGLLAKAVHLHDPDGRKPLVLIDEYDAPVNRASSKGYFREMTSFVKLFLSGALKDNDHVRMGIMAGVLRVAKEGILSGLNNLKVWTVFDERYNVHFGFTEEEVAELAAYYDVPEKMTEIKAWYDGYVFGGVEIYNPWSVLNYFDRNCEPKPYWLDTSSNDLITDIIRDLPHDTCEALERLLRDGRALVPMTQELGPYAEIKNRPETLFALLVSSGYLKCLPPAEDEDLSEGQMWVAMPNRELEKVFVSDIVCKTRRYTPNGESDAVACAIVLRDAEAFREALQQFLTESVSYFDGAAESFYHGLVLGFLAILRRRYLVRSNRESGGGRYDIALFPQMEGFPGVIIEIKAAKSAAEDLAALARSAREQIDTRQYATEMAAQGIADVLKLGLGFFGKRVALVK